tara:strand:+ start:1390 stop:1635 length:246 start_codon:yes stop_codon:yes gene_type:complete
MVEMGPFTAYSIVHVLLWFIVARYTKLSWEWFFVLSVGWEVFEWIISFYTDSNFFVENTINRVTDIVLNVIGFYLGGKKYS